jgi:hypothetical protein
MFACFSSKNPVLRQISIALKANQSGLCPNVKHINLFVDKAPYLALFQYWENAEAQLYQKF